MLVSKAIEYLSEYKPDDEIFIAWWDKEHIEVNMEKEISNEIWEIAVMKTEKAEYWASAASETLIDFIEEEIK